MKMKKFIVAGAVAMMLQGVSPSQAQQVTNKADTTGDIISYMLLGAAIVVSVWYLLPAAAVVPVAAGTAAAETAAGAGMVAAAALP